MLVAIHRPRGRLADLVETLTYTEGYLPSHDRELLLPDGAANIIVDLGERPKRLYTSVRETDGRDFRRAWISGMHAKPIVIEAQPGAGLFIIRFTAAGAGAVIGPSIMDLLNGVEPLDAVAGQFADELRERLLEAGTAADKFAAAEDWLLARAVDGGRPGLLAAHVAMRLTENPMQRIGTLADGLGISDRHLRDVFSKSVGMSPKLYQRVTRFQALLRAMTPGRGESLVDLILQGESAVAPDWADLAHQFGYVDQAHLSREFREFAGMSPGQYVRSFRGLTSYLPITL